MPDFEHTINMQTQTPEESIESANSPQTKLFVVAFKDFFVNEPAIITRPGGRLLTGTRTIVDPNIKYDRCPSIERDATEIAREHQITATAHAQLHLADGPIPYTQGYSVQRANHSALPNIADFTNHSTPTEHDLPLELHTYSRLLVQLDGHAEFRTEAAYLRAFGDFVLNRSR